MYQKMSLHQLDIQFTKLENSLVGTRTGKGTHSLSGTLVRKQDSAEGAGYVTFINLETYEITYSQQVFSFLDKASVPLSSRHPSGLFYSRG
jgi:hypothetical protein